MKARDIVWVFTAEQARDGEVAETIVEVFKTEEDAIKHLHTFIEYIKRNGWEVELIQILYTGPSRMDIMVRTILNVA